MDTQIITDDITLAAEIIRQGGLVAVPTETVYGLAGNGLDADAVAQIYEVKGRPSVKPLSLMVPDADAMDRYCLHVPDQARRLAERFWPGPLTIILDAKAFIPEIVLAGGSTVGLRCPDHPLTLSLLRECGLPLAAPSANPSGEESPKDADKVKSYFDGRIEAIMDGGPCGFGRESTIIDMTAAPYRILRQGALPAEKIANCLADGLKLIGVTGGTGCGKTTALLEWEALGTLIIDCDKVYHDLTMDCPEMLAEIEAAFPGAVKDHVLDRKALGARVFADAELLLQLNRITHRYVGIRVRELLRAHAMAGGRYAVIDAIELISSGLAAQCETTVAVIADREKRVERIMLRDQISREYAEARINAQHPDSYYRENCDYILVNNADPEQFQANCRQFFKEIINHG